MTESDPSPKIEARIVPPPVTFTDGRPWLDSVRVSWEWPAWKPTDFEDLPVKFNDVTVGHIAEAGADEHGIRVTATILPEYAGLFGSELMDGFTIARETDGPL